MRPKLTPSTGTPVPRKTRQPAQHPGIAAEDSGNVDVRVRSHPPGCQPMLLRLVGGELQLDTRLAGHVGEPRERRADRLRLAVRVRTAASLIALG